MLAANLQEDLGFSLNGGLDGAWDVVTSAVSKTGSLIKDGAKQAGSAIVDAGAWAADKTCSLVNNPATQAAAAGAAVFPSGATQTGAAAVAAGTIACGALLPSPGPTMPQPPAGVPSQSLRTLMTTQRFAKMAPKAPAAPAIPAGSIAAFDPKAGGFRVAIPGPPRLSGLAGLAEAFTEVGVSPTLPANARLVDLKTFEQDTGAKKPLLKRPLVLAAIGVGVVGAGVGGYMLLRRR